MRGFDGKGAATEYMSSHTMTFSTPELIITRFAFWLGDTIRDPDDKAKTMPRVMSFMTDQDFEPEPIDDSFAPGGPLQNIVPYEDKDRDRFCAECGNKLSASAKFCNKCGMVWS